MHDSLEFTELFTEVGECQPAEGGGTPSRDSPTARPREPHATQGLQLGGAALRGESDVQRVSATQDTQDAGKEIKSDGNPAALGQDDICDEEVEFFCLFQHNVVLLMCVCVCVCVCVRACVRVFCLCLHLLSLTHEHTHLQKKIQLPSLLPHHIVAKLVEEDRVLREETAAKIERTAASMRRAAQTERPSKAGRAENFELHRAPAEILLFTRMHSVQHILRSINVT